MNMKQAAIASAIALGVVGVAAYGHGNGGGMMGGYGGYGMGPGMMGGYGMGAGMMGGHGYGMSPGAFGSIDSEAIERLGLNDQQRGQVVTVQDNLRKKNLELMDRMHDEMTKLRNAGGSSGKRDWDLILAGNRRLSELRQQMAENSIKATRDVEALLTPQQRARFEQFGRPCFDGDRD